jgi:NTP pyrophosphatase (non-canonical NTP hydrolase)
MKMNDYQQDVMRTAAMGKGVEFARMVFGLGVAGEAGEVADLVKKELGHGHPEDKAKVKKELGDVLWYVAALAETYGLSLAEVAEANLEKLRKRYPNGFSSEASLNRKDGEA